MKTLLSVWELRQNVGRCNENLKDKQKKELDLLLQREDCIAELPTGYGKSLPYQMLVPLRREMGTDDKNLKVIVCSPWVAIMRDQ